MQKLLEKTEELKTKLEEAAENPPTEEEQVTNLFAEVNKIIDEWWQEMTAFIAEIMKEK